MPECASTKLVNSSLIGVWLFTASPSFCAAHCSQRCFSIFLPPLISVRCTVAVLLQLSHFMLCCPSHSDEPAKPAYPPDNRISRPRQGQSAVRGRWVLSRARPDHSTPDKSRSFPASPR